VVLGARHVPADQDRAERFASAWERGDYAAMYAQITDADRQRLSRLKFVNAYQGAMRTATASRLLAGKPRKSNGVYRVPVTTETRAFGTVTGDIPMSISDGGIAWSRAMLFPGLAAGERLRRVTKMPPRATLLARDRTVLAKGDARGSSSPLAAQVVGQLGPIPPERKRDLTALGVPADARVGVSGLERVFDEQLIGRPGGELLAGKRVLRATVPEQAPAVRTTISMPVEQAAVSALTDRLGGSVAVDPRSGAVLAFAGIAFSGLQPPGSTFKMVTATGALEAGITNPSKTYPVQNAATLEGVELENANGEYCGGNLVASFAKSCNSVFAPLGAQLGARRLVDVAERFGFNRDPGVPGAAMSTIPAAEEIGDNLAVGSSAIGQGRVQATALEMAIVAATIGRRGLRPRPTFDFDAATASSPTVRATKARTARTVERLMLAVVRNGTGVAAAIPGVAVAGKTGTAELKTTTRCRPDPANPDSCPPQPPDDPTDTDAWFSAYAPAGRGAPRIAVGVLLVASGAGGTTAAPAARDVLSAGLRASTSAP